MNGVMHRVEAQPDDTTGATKKPPLSLEAGVNFYIAEHLVAQGRDPKRMDIVKKHSSFNVTERKDQ